MPKPPCLVDRWELEIEPVFIKQRECLSRKCFIKSLDSELRHNLRPRDSRISLLAVTIY